jgi:hypothetical protein
MRRRREERTTVQRSAAQCVVAQRRAVSKVKAAGTSSKYHKRTQSSRAGTKQHIAAQSRVLRLEMEMES